MGLTYNPQMIRRWDSFRQAYTEREKDNWVDDFVRAMEAAPPPPVTLFVPAPQPQPQERLSDTERVFARLRARFE